MIKTAIALLILVPSMFAITWQEASEKISQMSFEEYKAYIKTDEYKEARKSFTENSMYYTSSIKYTSSKKVVSLDKKGKELKKNKKGTVAYKLLVVDAVLTNGKIPNKDDVKSFMETLLDKTITENQDVDAITINLAKSASDKSIALAEWWPKEHKLTSKNQKNIDDKSSYLKNIEVVNTQWQEKETKKKKKDKKKK